MTTHMLMRTVLRVLCGVILMLVPVFRPDGQLWMIAALSTLTVYEGATTRVVYGSTVFLALSEIIYGGDVGVASIGYICAVVLFLMVRRFLSVTAWSTQDGWRLVDAARTLVAGVLFCMSALACSVVAGHLIFGYGLIAERIVSLLTTGYIIPIVWICAATAVIVRRIAIPFRREILFGT
jgi:hypothetical protein